MTDRELLVLAAKAAGLPDTSKWSDFDWDVYGWSPLTDDGQALRLAVKLDMDVCRGLRGPEIGVAVLAMRGSLCVAEFLGSDSYAATRRAITRAAAEIGTNGRDEG